MQVLFVSFLSNQRITQKSIIFHPRDFSYGFQRNLYKCTIYMSFFIKKSIFFVFSKLDLTLHSILFKEYYILYHSLSKSSLKSRSNARGIT